LAEFNEHFWPSQVIICPISLKILNKMAEIMFPELTAVLSFFLEILITLFVLTGFEKQLV